MEDNATIEPRAKRQKTDKYGRSAALAKLRQLKGSKNKYEVNEIESVYDVVDENEYSKRVLERQYDDWIVDDNGSGYVEDGREIFDDNWDSDSVAAAIKEKGKSKKKRNVSDLSTSKGNLQHMLSTMQSKKKEEKKLNEDDLLKELISELDDDDDGGPSTSFINKKQPTYTMPKQHLTFTPLAKKQAAKEYLSSFTMSSSVSNKENSNSSNEKLLSRRDDSSKMEKPSERIFKELKQHLSEKNKIETESVEMENKDTERNSNNFAQTTDNVKSQEVNDSPKESQSVIEPDAQDLLFNDDFDLSQIKDIQLNEETVLNKSTVENTDEQLLNGWETMQENVCNVTQLGIDVDVSKFPLITNEEGKKVFRFFWWDAFEDQRNKPGVVFLFGKVYSEASSAYISCSVAVRNIERKIYLLPRTEHNDTKKPIALIDVYNEFNDIVANELNLDTFKSRKVTKNYCFDPKVPVHSEYLEIRYSAKYQPLESMRNGKTFSRIFGTNSSFLEIFLLERKIKGPCWLEVVNPELVQNPLSWCKFEVNCNKVSDISVVQNDTKLSPPPLVVATLNIKTAVNKKTLTNEIVMITCLIHNEYFVNQSAPKVPFQQHFCVFTRPGDQIFPLDLYESIQKYKATKVQKMDTERSLINYFVNQFHKLDPDLIVGHDLLGYQITVLCDRLISHKSNTFSKLSRIKRNQVPFKHKFEQQLFTGRLVCDIKISAKELIKSRSYDLQTLCQTVLKIKDNQRVDIEPEDVPRCYQSSVHILKLISFTMQDTEFILKMMYELNVIPLALQITNIAGNVMSRTLMGGRSERNEFLLLHAFHEKDYIVPDKNALRKKKGDLVEGDEQVTARSSRKKPAYSGGLVLEPKVGFYDKFILLMDFNSLYPSIIQEYNICFTTLPDTAQDNFLLPDQNLPPGILPVEIRKLVESRREVKKLMNNPDLTNDLKMQYNIRQMALKLTANSMYGCLGFSNSRFYAKSLAALVTHKGREILTNTKDLVQKMTHEVIYGDTDSIMINTNCTDYDQVMKIGIKIKQEINKLYRQIELDIDGVFKYLLLLKKKKYAAVTLTKSKSGQLVTAQEHKGLDLVRRDWSQLAAEAGKFILNCIFNDQTSEDRIENIHAHLRKLKGDLEQNEVPLHLLIITKQLTKDPRMYADKLQLPHVQVALRYNQKSGKILKAGDTVPYVICDDGTDAPPMQRAYHVDEFKNSDKLKIDNKYYLAQQIHPVVSRLCEPIEGTDAYEIANCLGLDNTAFKKMKDNNTVTTGENLRSKEVVFRNVEPFIFKCTSCKSDNTVRDYNRSSFLEKCTNLECSMRPVDYLPSIQNKLYRSIRVFIYKYYKNELTCEDPGCPNDTVRIPLKFAGRFPVCTLCHGGVMYKKYSEEDLYMQLLYYQHLFDLSKHEKKKTYEARVEDAYETLRKTVEKFLNRSGYAIINLSDLFNGFLLNQGNTSKERQVDEVDIVLDEDDDEF